MKVFKEEQRFTQLWLIILIIFSSLVPIGVVISEYQKDENAFSVEMLLVIILVIIKSIKLVEVPGIEPGSFVSKTALLRA